MKNNRNQNPPKNKPQKKTSPVPVTTKKPDKKHKNEEIKISNEDGKLDLGEDLFRYLFENSPIGVSIILPSGKVNLNRTFAAILGYTPDELQTKKWQDFTHPDVIETTQSRMDELVSGSKESQRWETRFLHKTGGIVWVDISSTLRRDINGKPLYFLTSVVDITGQKQAEEKLKLSEARYRNLVETQDDIVARSDLAGNLTFVNDAYCQAFKKTRTALLGTNYTPTVMPEDLPITLEALEAIKKPPYRKQTETRLITPSGIRWFSWENSAILDDTGNVIELQGVGRDITDRKKADQALHESEERFRRLTEVTFEGIIIHDGGKVVDANPAVLAMFGYELSEVLGQNILKFTAPESHELIIKSITSGNEKTIEARGLKKDGTIIPLEILGKAMPSLGPTVRVTALHDITERKQAEDQLRRSEEKWRSLVNTIPEYIAIHDRDGRFLFLNHFAEGFSEKDVIGVKLDDYLAPESVPLVKQKMDEVRKTGKNVRFEYRALGDHNTMRDYDQYLVPLKGPNEELEILTIARDITDIRQTERALHATKDYWQSLVENTSDLVTVIDANGVITYQNQAVERLLGYKVNEFVGKNANDFIHPEDMSHAWEVFSTSEPKSRLEYPTIELRVHHKDGSWRIMETTGEARQNDSGQLVAVLTSRDITERKRSEDALRMSEDKFKYIFENSIIGNSITSPSGEVHINSAFARMLGYSQEELEKHKWQVLTYPDDIDENQKIVDSILSGEKESYQWEKRYISKTGEIVWADVSTFLRRDESGKPLYFMTSIVDITERKRAEVELKTERNLMRTLIDNLPDAIYAKDTRSRFILGNTAVARVMGAADPAELIGKTDHDYYPEDLANQYFEDEQKVIQSGKATINREEKIIYPDGSEGWVLTTQVPLLDPNGSVTGVVGVGRTITERRQAEVELKKRLGELETVSRISTILRGARVVDEILPLLLDETLRTMGTDTGDIWLLVPATGKLHQAISRGWLKNTEEGDIAPGEGIAGNVFRTGVPYISSEFTTDTKTYKPSLAFTPAGWGGVCVPIRAEQETIGVLFVCVQLPRKLENQDVSLLTTISEIAGNAIRRVRLYQETLNQLQRLAALRSMDTAISSVMDMKVILDILLGHILTQLKVDAADILLLQSHTQLLEYQAGVGFHSQAIQRFSERMGEGHAGRAALERKIVGEPNNRSGRIAACARVQQIPEEGFVAHFAAPLLIKGQVKGVLETFHRSAFTPDGEWLEFLETLARQVAIAVDNTQMFDNLQTSNFEMMMAYDETIEGWSQAMDLRDKETEGHSQRVTELTLRLAEKLGSTPEELVHIRRGALLHDIGKLGVPDEILRKTGPLNDDEWVQMKKHPQSAYDMLSPIKYLHPALDIPYCHHEKWDGSGYPRGLSGEQIPLVARIFSVVDVYDALTSDRPYRKAWTKEKTITYIQEQSGKYFDPRVVNAFMRELEK